MRPCLLSRTASLAALSCLFASPDSFADPPAESKSIRALIITGENNHDWKATTPVLRAVLERARRFQVEVSEDLWGGVTEAALAPFDVLVLNFNPTSGKKWSDGSATAFIAAVAMKGKGAVVVHAANNAFPGWREYEGLLGGAWRDGAGHGSFHSFLVDVTDREHPITRGFPRAFLQAPDELYHGLTMEPGVRVLALAYSSRDSGGTAKYEPMAWVHRHGRGRVFHTPLGHAASSMESAGFASLLARGAEWAATGEVTVPAEFPEWQPLANGKDLTGWRGSRQIWKVVDGVITGESPGIRHNDFLVTDRRFSDFTLKLKVRLVPDEENSGVQFRSERLPNGEMYGYQADIGKGWWGSLYDESTGRNLLVDSYAARGAQAVRKNDWNDYEVEAVGPKIKVRINGTVTSEFEDPLQRPDGHIAVQVHSGGPLKVEFKDIFIREN
jgi:type 1 glutamine amidotransferase